MAPDHALAGFLGKRVQLAHVVHDLDAALRYWTETMGVGPFVVFERSRDGRTVLFRGVETAMDVSLAFAYMGDVQIELIQPLDDQPSPFREFLQSGREGLHHVGFWPDNFEAACDHLEVNGFREFYTILVAGKRNGAYYEGPKQIGLPVELVPLTPQRAEYFARIQRLGTGWDGVERPIRRFADRAAFLASAEGLSVGAFSQA